MEQKNYTIQIPEFALFKFLFSDTRTAWFWLLVRIYVGWQWLEAGWGKLHNPAWVGLNTGVVIKGFLAGALQKTAGAHPDVAAWYADFIKNFVMQHVVVFSYLVTYGEFLVGLALIFGIFTGIAAFFGGFMNMNYLLAGTVSSNPILLILEFFLILAWRVVGWYGLDYYVLKYRGLISKNYQK